ncbi:proline-rich receptor-like protein kinase PERK9 [Iris pallida]|uniref:Proline-rich receptor-like protein kinase PERK9 n=1 Tax=Iris pallida TaxID=29817 RepID=A0AAX6IKR1_IRIPA|nr:proline-rich receptor-like protein kinase PERK9 [Iris pallida]KAJ6853829.1 proline-rich receptor-like protein kinase PERK9 [Iris pallida]
MRGTATADRDQRSRRRGGYTGPRSDGFDKWSGWPPSSGGSIAEAPRSVGDAGFGGAHEANREYSGW